VLTVLEFLPSSHGSFFAVVCDVQLLSSGLGVFVLRVSCSKLAAPMPGVIVFSSRQMRRAAISSCKERHKLRVLSQFGGLS
jgi:hypothetical protein